MLKEFPTSDLPWIEQALREKLQQMPTGVVTVVGHIPYIDIGGPEFESEVIERTRFSNYRLEVGVSTQTEEEIRAAMEKRSVEGLREERVARFKYWGTTIPITLFFLGLCIWFLRRIRRLVKSSQLRLLGRALAFDVSIFVLGVVVLSGTPVFIPSFSGALAAFAVVLSVLTALIQLTLFGLARLRGWGLPVENFGHA